MFSGWCFVKIELRYSNRRHCSGGRLKIKSLQTLHQWVEWSRIMWYGEVIEWPEMSLIEFEWLIFQRWYLCLRSRRKTEVFCCWFVLTYHQARFWGDLATGRRSWEFSGSGSFPEWRGKALPSTDAGGSYRPLYEGALLRKPKPPRLKGSYVSPRTHQQLNLIKTSEIQSSL